MFANKIVEIRKRWQKIRFRFVVERAKSLPPLSNFDNDCGVVFVSMVQKKEVASYLLAVASFNRFVACEKIIVVEDGTIDESDRRLIKSILVNVNFLSYADYQKTNIPVGGCWERIAAIAELVDSYYIVQLDSDTVTLSDPKEVRSCIESNSSFTQGTNLGKAITSCGSAISLAKSYVNKGDKHIQLLAESFMEGLHDKFCSYVRGSAGFAGYAKGSFNTEQLIEISDYYYKKLGASWEEWGSEQFASNLLIANMEDSIVLPVDRYAIPYEAVQDPIFLHFVGSVRFTSGLYRKSALQVIEELISRS